MKTLYQLTFLFLCLAMASPSISQKRSSLRQDQEDRAMPPGVYELGTARNLKTTPVATALQSTQRSTGSAPTPGVKSLTVSQNYYISHSTFEPWTEAFGSGNWIRLKFNDPDMATIFTSATHFIFIDGSAGNGGAELNNFFVNHRTALENWVAAGGRLLLNGSC
jgi:hypothetical protein